MEIDNTNNRDDERRTEQRKQQAKTDAERKQKLEPMKTFEAKLSEKATADEAGKKSQQTANRDQLKSQKDKQDILKKILDSGGKTRSELDHNARVAEMQEELQKRQSGEETAFVEKLKDEGDDDIHHEKTKSADRTDEKGSGEVSEDGHKRVAEKQDGEGGSPGSGGGDSSSGQQGADAGSSFSGDHKDQGQSQSRVKDLFGSFVLAPLSGNASGQHGFQQNARQFAPQDLDELVAHVQLGLNRGGEEFFSIELSDKYFQGLKLLATRTPQGIVIRFECPNIAVRSTFLKYRPQVYAHLKAKNISVFRVDIV